MTGRCLLYYVSRRSRYHCGAVLFSGHPRPLVSAEFTESIPKPGKATSTSALDTPPTTKRILVGPKASISSVAAGLASAETPRLSARRCLEFRPWKQPTSKKKSNVPRSGARSVTSPTTKVAPQTLLRLAASIARDIVAAAAAEIERPTERLRPLCLLPAQQGLDTARRGLSVTFPRSDPEAVCEGVSSAHVGSALDPGLSRTKLRY